MKSEDRDSKDGSRSRLSSSPKSLIAGDSEAERAQRGRPRDEASGRSDDTGAQRVRAVEREGASKVIS